MNWQTKLLAAAYFAADVAINYSLYGQLSINSNFFTVQSLEMWGKIITGLGAAMLIIQVAAFFNDTFKTSAIAWFLGLCVLTIPLSFYAQNAIVEGIVDKAGEKEINNAILLSVTKSTLVPYYDFSLANYGMSQAVKNYDKVTFPFRAKIDITGHAYIENEKHFFALGAKCAQHSEKALGITADIDKALFSFKAIRSSDTLNEALYKDLITDFYTCLYADSDYSAAHSKEVNQNQTEARQAINSKYREYVEKSGEYSDALRKAKRLSWGGGTDRVEKAWRQGVNRQLGFSTTIKPNMSFDEFAQHPDVKKAYFREAGKDAIYPFGAEWDKYLKEQVVSEIIKALPDAALEGYRNQDGTLIEMSEGKKPEQETVMVNGIEYTVAQPGIDPDYLKHGFPTEKDKGQQAYKAIVVPIIGLALSAFFLVFNLISVVAGYLSSKSKVLGVTFFIIGLVWAALWPHYSLGQAIDTQTTEKQAEEGAVDDNLAGDDRDTSGVSKVSNSEKFDYEDFLINALYYHEKNLGKLYKSFH